jgi:hypothetical protein
VKPTGWAVASVAALVVAGAAVGFWVLWQAGQASAVFRQAQGARPVDPLEDSLRTLMVGERTARLETGRRYPRAGTERWPLVVVLHDNADLRGSGAAARWAAIRRQGWFLLFPEGVASADPAAAPGAPVVHRWAPEGRDGDVAHVEASIRQVSREYRIDPGAVVLVAGPDTAILAWSLTCGEALEGLRAVVFDAEPPPCGAVDASAVGDAWVGDPTQWSRASLGSPDTLRDWLAGTLPPRG